MEKINLYERRDFGGNFNLTFTFLKQNYGAICKTLCYFIPLFLIIAYFLKNEGSVFDNAYSPIGNFSSLYIAGMVISYILYIVAFFIINTYVICYVVEYAEGNNVNISASHVWARVKSSIFPLILSGILYTLAVAFGFMLCLIPGIILAVYWIFYSYAYVAHERGITECLSSSYYLVKESWWVTFGYVLIFGIIIVIAQIIFAVPSYIGMAGELLQISFLQGELFSYFASIIVYMGYLFLAPIMYVALGVMYYSLRTDVYGVDIDMEIDKLGLGKTDEDQ